MFKLLLDILVLVSEIPKSLLRPPSFLFWRYFNIVNSPLGGIYNLILRDFTCPSLIYPHTLIIQITHSILSLTSTFSSSECFCVIFFLVFSLLVAGSVAYYSCFSPHKNYLDCLSNSSTAFYHDCRYSLKMSDKTHNLWISQNNSMRIPWICVTL